MFLYLCQVILVIEQNEEVTRFQYYIKLAILSFKQIIYRVCIDQSCILNSNSSSSERAFTKTMCTRHEGCSIYNATVISVFILLVYTHYNYDSAVSMIFCPLFLKLIYLSQTLWNLEYGIELQPHLQPFGLCHNVNKYCNVHLY